MNTKLQWKQTYTVKEGRNLAEKTADPQQTKCLSEQVSGDGALNGCDREKAARGSSTEEGSDPETASKCSFAGPFRKKISPPALRL